MTRNNDTTSDVQPVILAGGLGSRLRPRTNHLPKPLLPIWGRPILWYTLQALRDTPLPRPIVCIDYLGTLIETYFENADVTFRQHQHETMAETVLREAESSDADAILGMSADVLLGPRAVPDTLQAYSDSGHLDTVLLVQLPQEGHKKWRFVIAGNRLRDIEVADRNTNYERLLLILRRDSLMRLREATPSPINEKSLTASLNPYQTGWILLLKLLLDLGIPIYAQTVVAPVCNINITDDFQKAEDFIDQHFPHFTGRATP